MNCTLAAGTASSTPGISKDQHLTGAEEGSNLCQSNPTGIPMAFWDAVAYVCFPRCPAERARSVRRRAKDVRDNGRGPRAGEVEQWDRWDKTRPLHKRGNGAFVPEEFVANDTKRIRSNDEADIHIRGDRSGRKPSQKRAVPSSQWKACPNAKAYHTPGGIEAQYSAPREAQSGGEHIGARNGARNVGMSTVNVGHWQQSQGRWPFSGIR